MSNIEKIPIKRAELSVKRFNEIAVPHHLGLLKNHKSNIEKCLALGNWAKIKKEEINAMRIIKQLKNLLLEMDALRSKVREDDVDKFDELISEGKQKTLDAIRDFLELQLKSLTSTKSSNGNYNPSNEIVPEAPEDLPQIQTEYHAQEHQLRARQACLNEVENLHREVEDLHGIYRNVNEMVHGQGEQVEAIANNTEEALENVSHGERKLRQALKYKKTLYPVMGALLGTCVGGPIGLIVGLKAGGLAAVGCGILGFTGGSVLKMNDRTPDSGVIAEEHEKRD